MTAFERGLLMAFYPYPEGIEVDLGDWKSRYVAALRDLAGQDYFIEKPLRASVSHIRLSDKALQWISDNVLS